MKVSGYNETNFKETEIGLIPAGWELHPLSHLATVKYGKARPQNKGNVPVVGSSGIFAWADTSLVEFPTIVVGRKGSAGQVWLIKSPSWIADTAFYLEWKHEVNIDYLAAYLDLHKLSGEHAQTTMPSLQKPDLENLLVALPSIPEQRRIAAVLNAIQDEIATQDDIITEAREFKRSLMQRLFTYGAGTEPAETKETEIGEIPIHWEIEQLGDFAEIEMGQSPQGDTYNYERTGIPLINGPTEFTFRTPMAVKWTTKPTKICAADDILFCVRGNTTGRMNIADQVYCIGRGVAAIRGKHLISETQYIFTWLQQESNAILALATAGGSTFPNITKNELFKLKIPVPNLQEQSQISQLIGQVDSKIAIEEDRKAAMQDFFKTMLHQLMTGQIRLLSDEGLPL